MVAVLFNLVFYTITAITNLITKVVFTTTAYFIVVMLQAFKAQGEATKGVLEQIGNIIRSILEYVFELIIDLITTLISTIFDKIKDGLVESIVSGASTAGDLLDQTKTSLEDLLKDVPEIIQGFSEMLVTLVTDLWNNYFEAIDYVKENA
ncbi:hypothetical protein RND81_05G227100 [Saponaria officinalis]|uniref:Uncharacterized protein n=1 Tax=Saponaria officinalis TaxID=3572 RepID=A0AAW1L1G9_SAPOF